MTMISKAIFLAAVSLQAQSGGGNALIYDWGLVAGAVCGDRDPAGVCRTRRESGGEGAGGERRRGGL